MALAWVVAPGSKVQKCTSQLESLGYEVVDEASGRRRLRRRVTLALWADVDMSNPVPEVDASELLNAAAGLLAGFPGYDPSDRA
jgi:hypothetical protein